MLDGHLPSMFHMHTAIALRKMKRHITGVVNTAHGPFAKGFPPRISFFGTFKE
jgi:hypothetical protein